MGGNQKKKKSVREHTVLGPVLLIQRPIVQRSHRDSVGEWQDTVRKQKSTGVQPEKIIREIS
jgi:hypothetical protein